jgi:NAD(P)-dependent dehydrogenase (short-subunit alcohol dehydrogenase family)
MAVAVVTGSDSGIGRAAAVALADDGFDVGVTWHSDEDGARGTAREITEHGRRAEVRQLDLTSLPEAADRIDEMCEALGGIDVLVNNAGAGASSPFVDADWDSWRSVLDVDLNGAFLLSQRAARRMIAQGRGGRIVNVTSVHEHVPLRGSAAYCAAKGGLGMLTKDVDPGRIDRPMIPANRPGDAREIAAVIAFLASPGASYVTGASVVADGGLLLMAAIANQDANSRG